MDKITEHSPKRLIVVDAVDDLARGLFADRYEYWMVTTMHDPLEKLHELVQPRWTTVLGEESTELINYGKTLANDVLVNVLLVAPVPSSHLAHAIPYLEDVEVMKRSLIGTMIDHKGHTMTCNTQSEKFPAFSTEHDIDYFGSGLVLRIQFAVVLRIHDEGK